MTVQPTPLLPFTEVARLPLPDAALAYAQAGIPVFPCWPGTKNPATTHGFYEATTNLRRVGFWWRRNPEANIGVRTGGVVDVLDIDAHAAGTGFGPLQELRRLGLIDGWAHAARSPSGGVHLYYPADPDRPQRTWAQPGSHIDVRASGGYIVTVPSRILIDGQLHPYTPIGSPRPGRPLDAARIRAILAPPPPRPRVPLSTDVSERVGRLRSWLSMAQEGNRNASLFWVACRMVELGVSEHDTVAQLGDVAARIGLDDREIISTIRSAHRTTSVTTMPTAAGPPAQATLLRGVP